MLFKEIKIWKRVDDGLAIVYCCFLNIKTNKYAVQSADFYRTPVKKEQLDNFNKQCIELFIDLPLEERCDKDSWFESLEEAIKAHDTDFSNI